MSTSASPTALSGPPSKLRWYKILYVQVLVAVGLGIFVGYLFPSFGASLKPLGDGFIKLVKMMIAPIVFCTVVHGIASMGDLGRLGRIGAKTLIYFEVVSTLALLIGLAVVNFLEPGAGFTAPSEPVFQQLGDDPGAQQYSSGGNSRSFIDHVINIIPSSFLGAFVSGELLQVLFVAVLVAFAIRSMGEHGQPALNAIEYATRLLFGLMNIVVKAAPIGAFGAMAFTVGSYGLGAMNRLLYLMAGFYLTALLFVFVVLGSIAAYSGFSILRFLTYIKDELLLVLGTSSSEVALPGLMEKMQRLGCSKSTVGLVIPTGFSFNLDGTNIYMSMAVVFLAQATNTPLSITQQLGFLCVAMITSKGASGVTGAGFVALAATLEAVPSIPIESLALLIGIDRFMSECRALTNLVGNGVATVVVSRWENEISAETLRSNLNSNLGQAGTPEATTGTLELSDKPTSGMEFVVSQTEMLEA